MSSPNVERIWVISADADRTVWTLCPEEAVSSCTELGEEPIASLKARDYEAARKVFRAIQRAHWEERIGTDEP